jgi:hypothetical protein
VRFFWALAILLTLISGSAVSAEPLHRLPNGTTVRIQSADLLPGWHIGKLEITREGCAIIWMSSSEVPGGRHGLGLMFLSKLERQDGPAWIDVPIAPLMEKEPKSCQNGAG